jgi:hypothetical protein
MSHGTKASRSTPGAQGASSNAEVFGQSLLGPHLVPRDENVLSGEFCLNFAALLAPMEEPSTASKGRHQPINHAYRGAVLGGEPRPAIFSRASGFVRARTRSMNSSVARLSDRFFRMMIPTSSRV